MKQITASLQAHMLGDLTTLAELVKITRTDGVVLGMTSHDADLVYDGVTYKADGSFSPGTMKENAELKGNAYDIAGLLDSEVLAADDIRKGLYDYARIDVFLCNWADLSCGVLRKRRGWLGEVGLEGERFVASLRGLHDLLNQRVGETYTPECRYDLGDGRCSVNLAALKVMGSVTSVTDKRQFGDYTRSEATGTFNDAVLTWTSGANAGAKTEVYGWDLDSATFTLWLPAENEIALGDGYEIAPGCDKRFATCRSVFANGANYGGFPYLPGIGKILDYPEARS